MHQINRKSLSIGEAIRTARRRQGLRLASVEQNGYVALSTISAVERGRRIPSLSVLDSITQGLRETIGTFDLAYLVSANDISQREAVYRRLMEQPNPPILTIQAILGSRCKPLHINESLQLSRHDRHVRILLADLMVRRQQWRRAIILICRAVLGVGAPLESEFKVRGLSLLGKCYLYIKRPDDALAALLEACRIERGG